MSTMEAMHTIEDIEKSTKAILTPTDVHEVLGCDPNNINVQAKKDPSKLGFPVCLIGCTVRIPKDGFVYWYRYGNVQIVEK